MSTVERKGVAWGSLLVETNNESSELYVQEWMRLDFVWMNGYYAVPGPLGFVEDGKGCLCGTEGLSSLR